jgi:DNA-binding NarL/FixJ family response regulator
LKPAKQHSILIAYPNQSMLDGMVAVLAQQSDLLVAGTAFNCTELMFKVSQQLPDVCILNIDLPGVDVFQLHQNLQSQGIRTNIIVIADRCEQSLRKRIAASGIKACLINPFDVGELIYAVSKVLNGEEYLSSQNSPTTVYGEE